jgi:hypothetical protein
MPVSPSFFFVVDGLFLTILDAKKIKNVGATRRLIAP